MKRLLPCLWLSLLIGLTIASKGAPILEKRQEEDSACINGVSESQCSTLYNNVMAGYLQLGIVSSDPDYYSQARNYFIFQESLFTVKICLPYYPSLLTLAQQNLFPILEYLNLATSAGNTYFCNEGSQVLTVSTTTSSTTEMYSSSSFLSDQLSQTDEDISPSLTETFISSSVSLEVSSSSEAPQSSSLVTSLSSEAVELTSVQPQLTTVYSTPIYTQAPTTLDCNYHEVGCNSAYTEFLSSLGFLEEIRNTSLDFLLQTSNTLLANILECATRYPAIDESMSSSVYYVLSDNGLPTTPLFNPCSTTQTETSETLVSAPEPSTSAISPDVTSTTEVLDTESTQTIDDSIPTTQTLSSLVPLTTSTALSTEPVIPIIPTLSSLLSPVLTTITNSTYTSIPVDTESVISDLLTSTTLVPPTPSSVNPTYTWTTISAESGIPMTPTFSTLLPPVTTSVNPTYTTFITDSLLTGSNADFDSAVPVTPTLSTLLPPVLTTIINPTYTTISIDTESVISDILTSTTLVPPTPSSVNPTYTWTTISAESAIPVTPTFSSLLPPITTTVSPTYTTFITDSLLTDSNADFDSAVPVTPTFSTLLPPVLTTTTINPTYTTISIDTESVISDILTSTTLAPPTPSSVNPTYTLTTVSAESEISMTSTPSTLISPISTTINPTYTSIAIGTESAISDILTSTTLVPPTPSSVNPTYTFSTISTKPVTLTSNTNSPTISSAISGPITSVNPTTESTLSTTATASAIPTDPLPYNSLIDTIVSRVTSLIPTENLTQEASQLFSRISELFTSALGSVLINLFLFLFGFGEAKRRDNIADAILIFTDVINSISTWIQDPSFQEFLSEINNLQQFADPAEIEASFFQSIGSTYTAAKEIIDNLAASDSAFKEVADNFYSVVNEAFSQVNSALFSVSSFSISEEASHSFSSSDSGESSISGSESQSSQPSFESNSSAESLQVSEFSSSSADISESSVESSIAAAVSESWSSVSLESIISQSWESETLISESIPPKESSFAFSEKLSVSESTQESVSFFASDISSRPESKDHSETLQTESVTEDSENTSDGLLSSAAPVSETNTLAPDGNDLTTVTNTITKYTTVTSVEGTKTVTTEVPCETSTETVIIKPGTTITLTEPCTRCTTKIVTSTAVVTLVSTKADDEVFTVTATKEVSMVEEITKVPGATGYTTVTRTLTEECSQCVTRIESHVATTTYTSVFGSSTATFTKPFTITNTVVELPLSAGGILTSTVNGACSMCKTLTKIESGVSTYTTVSGDFVVTVTEPCESTYTVVESPVTIDGSTVYSTIAVHSTSLPTPVVTVPGSCTGCKTTTKVESGLTTYTKTSGDSVVTVTEPCSSTYTVVESPITTGGSTVYSTEKIQSSTVANPTGVVSSSQQCDSCKTSTKIASGLTTYTRTSGSSVVTVTEPCKSTYTVVESPVSSGGSTIYTVFTVESSLALVPTVTESCSDCKTLTSVQSGVTTYIVIESTGTSGLLATTIVVSVPSASSSLGVIETGTVLESVEGFESVTSGTPEVEAPHVSQSDYYSSSGAAPKVSPTSIQTLVQVPAATVTSTTIEQVNLGVSMRVEKLFAAMALAIGLLGWV